MADPEPPNERDQQQEQGDEQQKQEKWYERTRYQILLFAGSIALFVLVGGLTLDWYIAPKNSGQKKDLVQALGLLTAGVAGAVGIYFTWRGQRQARQAQENNQKNTLEQLEQSRNELAVHREGQITDRFTRAIDQLGKVDGKGNKLFEIRLGGIYALERIARESEEDHWPIMEVLTAYVRQNAPWRPEEGQEGTEDPAVEKEKPEKDSREKFESTDVSPLDPDIQAITTVLRRRTRSFGQGEPEPFDLHATNLTGANLSGANLSGANLGGASLAKANLSRANLAGADLTFTLVEHATEDGGWRQFELPTILEGTNLKGANLSGANLANTDLSRADLSGADFMSTDLTTAVFTQAQLLVMNGDKKTQLPPNVKPPAHWGV